MKLFSAHRAPSPRRVLMFMAEKAITGIEIVNMDLNSGEHRQADYLAKSPLAKVHLSLPRNTMSAVIEMADRRVELYLLGGIANAIRHGHPGLAALEKPQFPDFGRSQGEKVREIARWFDQQLQSQPWIAGERFTIADITAFCAVEFARLIKFAPGAEGLHALQAWRDRVADRPSAQAV